jgi:hypothetical protein
MSAVGYKLILYLAFCSAMAEDIVNKRLDVVISFQASLPQADGNGKITNRKLEDSNNLIQVMWVKLSFVERPKKTRTNLFFEFTIFTLLKICLRTSLLYSLFSKF